MSYSRAEILNFLDGLFYLSFLYMDGNNTAGTGSNLFEQFIDSFSAFFRAHISLKVPALTQLARYYYNPIGAGLERFDQVGNINLAGTRQADWLKIIII
jgi:hypothetical protein